MIQPKVAIKSFFDAPEIIRKLGKEKARAMKRAGALQAREMRSLFRRTQKKKSAPGEVPRVHVSSSDFGLKKIYFHYNEIEDSIIVGPIGGRKDAVPGLLNDGGIQRVEVPVKIRGQRSKKVVNIRIQARPFVKRARDKYANRYPDEFRNILNGR